MAYSAAYDAQPHGGGSVGLGGRATAGFRRESYVITAWWILVAAAGIGVLLFSHYFLPPKASYDALTLQAHLDSRDLWDGISFDSFVNTARVWWVVLHVLPEPILTPIYYCALVALTVRVLGVYEVRLARYHLLAGAWVVCSAFFLGGLTKEIFALPVAVWFCLAASRTSRFLATTLFLVYAAFFRQYWGICYFYFLSVLLAVRMHMAHRSRLAVLVLVVAYAAPFIAADTLGLAPLTDTRVVVNAERVDSPDARSAFNNPLENTGAAADVSNAAVAWARMNFPVALLVDALVPHYVFFSAFQLVSLWFFAAGFARFLQDAKRIRRADSVHMRCAAFVIAFSWTQSLFEPDFGSFLRHEMVLMIPLLIVVFYRAHAMRARQGPIRQP